MVSRKRNAAHRLSHRRHRWNALYVYIQMMQKILRMRSSWSLVLAMKIERKKKHPPHPKVERVL
jgi:hypothetical protein